MAGSAELVSVGVAGVAGGGWPGDAGLADTGDGEPTVVLVVGPGTVVVVVVAATPAAAAVAAAATVEPAGEPEGCGLVTVTGTGAGTGGWGTAAELGPGAGLGVVGAAAAGVPDMALSAGLSAVGVGMGAGTETGTTGALGGAGAGGEEEVFCGDSRGSAGEGDTCGGATPALSACCAATSCFTSGLLEDGCAAEVAGLLLAPDASGDRGLFRALGVAPGLEHAGGEDMGWGKGDVTLGDDVGGCGDTCATGLDFNASDAGLSCLRPPGLGC